MTDPQTFHILTKRQCNVIGIAFSLFFLTALLEGIFEGVKELWIGATGCGVVAIISLIIAWVFLSVPLKK
jgi:hypothetical protein